MENELHKKWFLLSKHIDTLTKVCNNAYIRKQIRGWDDEKDQKTDKIDKSFYTNSMTFDKNDFDSFEDVDGKEKISELLLKF